MANIQSKKVVNSNKKKLQTLHNKFGKKTILKLEKDNKQYREAFKKAVILATNKLNKFPEEISYIPNSTIEKVIKEPIINIFELPTEALTLNNSVQKFMLRIWNNI